LLFFNQTAAVLFPNSKLLFFWGTFFQQDSQKKLPGHNTTQHKTTQNNSLQIPGHKTSKIGSKNREKFQRKKEINNFFYKETDRSNNRNSATDFT
jgi:hypothetical protein